MAVTKKNLKKIETILKKIDSLPSEVVMYLAQDSGQIGFYDKATGERYETNRHRPVESGNSERGFLETLLKSDFY